ncbi:MAG: hypothetical protein FWC66_02370 [Oscillospiraceae bacterium]|nr:hypothetical protein [Oscillospiraceae bacterium]
MSQDILVAVDAGGTKTEFCVRALSGGDMCRFVYGGSNYRSSSIAQARRNLVDGFFETCKAADIHPDNVKGAVFGIAGCDTPEDMRIYRELVSEIGFSDSRIKLFNDCELAFLAAADAPGLCIVAGTGSNSMAFHPDRPVLRAGGLGALLSDGGSGFWIAQRVMRKMLLFSDGSGSYLPVYAQIARHFDIDDFTQVPFRFAIMTVPEIASAAQIILECAESGDPYAQETVFMAHNALLDLATTPCRRMKYNPDETLQVVLIGSLFKNQWFLERFWKGLIERISNPIERHLITTNPSENAMRLAEKIYGK